MDMAEEQVEKVTELSYESDTRGGVDPWRASSKELACRPWSGRQAWRRYRCPRWCAAGSRGVVVAVEVVDLLSQTR